MPSSTPHKSPTMERIHIQPGAKNASTTSVFLWHRDLDLLRALYRGSPGGYSVHIRGAVHTLCEHLRTQLRETERGRDLLHKLGQPR